MTGQALTRLTGVLEDIGSLAVAVSGGVDSMTLSVLAHEVLGDSSQMLHAVSPAVPADATERVRRYAQQYGWSLEVINAREFDDPRYMANPVNRCYYCKTNLYDTMSTRVDVALVSGTNLDDLGDYRPGLIAARSHGVRHPFVEAKVDKRTVRAIASSKGLTDLAELPASPCLSSRVETGIAIDPGALLAINRIEKLVRKLVSPEVVRLRIRDRRAVIELDTPALETLNEHHRDALRRDAGAVLAEAGVKREVEFAAYRMGSAFVRPAK